MSYLNRLCLTLLLVLTPALAFGLTVTNTNNDGPGSLRQAVEDTPDGGTVDFAVTGTITLLSPIIFTKSLNIVGPGADMLTLSGGNSSQVFIIGGTPSGQVNISGLRFINGFTNAAGGAIIIGFGTMEFGNPSFIFDKCVFQNNAAPDVGDGRGGGALAVFGNNENDNPSERISVTISNSTFIDNFGTLGGAILSSLPFIDVKIFNTTFESNSAISAGAIAHFAPFNSLEVYNSTFDRNIASCFGPACDNEVNGSVGGAIFAFRLSLDQDPNAFTNIYFNTFNNNRVLCNAPACEADGSALFVRFATNGPAAPVNPTIMSNIFNSDSDVSNCSPGIFITSLGYNVSSDGTCTGGPGDQPNTNPDLDPRGLQDNGGMTETIALLANSPAIDSGGQNCPPPDTDQRMVVRPQFTACDSGAFEFNGQVSAIPTLSEWGLIAMAAVIGLVGLLALRRKKAVI